MNLIHFESNKNSEIQMKLPQTRPTNMKAMERIISRRVTLKFFSIFKGINTWLPNPSWYRRYLRRRRLCLLLLIQNKKKIQFMWLGFGLRTSDWRIETRASWDSKSSNLVLPLCLGFHGAAHFALSDFLNNSKVFDFVKRTMINLGFFSFSRV